MVLINASILTPVCLESRHPSSKQRGHAQCHISIEECISTAHISHDDVIKWKQFQRYWPFVLGIHRSQMNSPHKAPWRGALMFSLTCALNKRLSKQSQGWWFETPSLPSWRHCNDIYILRSSYSNYHEHIEAQNMAAAWQTAGISYFDSNFMEICSQSSNKQKSSTGSDNGLAAKRWEAIIWINDGLTYRRIFALLGLEGLMSTYKDTPNTGFNQSSFIHFINM